MPQPRAFYGALALLLAATGQSAVAQSSDEAADPAIAAAAAEFERNNVGTSPQTRSELIRCSAYWLKWHEAVSKNYSASEIAKMPVAMRPEASKQTYDLTVKAFYGTIDASDPAEIDRANRDFTEQYQNAGFALAMQLLEPNAVTFFAQLGSCGRP